MTPNNPPRDSQENNSNQGIQEEQSGSEEGEVEEIFEEQHEQ
jgi:hypothetical protein